MSDLISRQALIEFLDDIPFLQQHYNLYVLLLDWINQQPKVGEWIPIGQYPSVPSLLCFENGEMVVGYYDYDAEEWNVQCSSEYFSCLAIPDDDGPIAWQPLPEPYKEGDT